MLPVQNLCMLTIARIYLGRLITRNYRVDGTPGVVLSHRQTPVPILVYESITHIYVYLCDLFLRFCLMGTWTSMLLFPSTMPSDLCCFYTKSSRSCIPAQLGKDRKRNSFQRCPSR